MIKLSLGNILTRKISTNNIPTIVIIAVSTDTIEIYTPQATKIRIKKVVWETNKVTIESKIFIPRHNKKWLLETELILEKIKNAAINFNTLFMGCSYLL